MDTVSQHHEFLTEKLVSNALGGVEIVSLESESAVPEGEHFLSTILRVEVTYRKEGNNSDEKTKIIVKSYPESSLDDFVKEYELMTREQTCYYKVLPHVTAVLGKQLFPKHLGPIEADSLILEDLSVYGFKMINRIERMDFSHCAAAMKVLADFHASSIVAYSKDPKIFDEIKKETMYVQDNPTQRNFCKYGFTALADEFEQIPHLKQYSNKLRLVSETLWDSVVEAVKVRENEVNVLAHGDFWTSNILFRYDARNRIEEVKLVDFQMSRLASPALDLITFFNTSIQRRSFLSKLALLYVHNVNTFVGKNIMSIEMLESVMMRFNCVGLLIAVCRLPMCILDISNPMNFVNYSKETKDSTNVNPYKAAAMDKKFQEMMPSILDYYIEVGLL